MAKYYANISGAANIQVPFNPYQVYTQNGNYVRLELNCDNLRTDSSKTNAAVWRNPSGGWFSFEMYGQGWEYFNLGSTTYIGRYNYWSTNGFEETLVLEIDNGSVTLTEGEVTSATTFDGSFSNNNISFFPDTDAVNTRVDFYEWKAYGANNTLLFDFVPDYNGTTKGLRDKVSGNFYAATDQTKIELIPLPTFEIAPTESAATYESGTTTITVNTDNDTSITWTASTSDSWLSLSTLTGAGDGSVTVTYGKNTLFQSRTGTVTFTSSDGDVLTFTIEQEKKLGIIYDHPIYRSGNLVKKMYRSGNLIYYRLNLVDYSSMYLTFEILDAVNNANIEWKANSSYTATIQYSKDGGTTWSSITSSYDNPPQIPVEEGDTILFKGDMYMATGKNMFNCFSSSTVGEMNIYGNIMSLLDSTGYTAATTIAAHSLRQLFVGLQSTVINAQNLKIQVVTVGNSSLKGLFSGCTYLENAPELPATILEESSYSDMFYGCAGLTAAPELPATVLSRQCYYNMFYNCSSLTTAPELPATTLAKDCYNFMFLGCTSLTTAPELPATTLVSNCYKNMFSGCTNLNYIKCLATDISASNCTSGWVNGVAASGTFVKNANATWRTGISGIPSGWTVQDAT